MPESLKISQDIWIETLPDGLFVANVELAFQKNEKNKRAAELALNNKELKNAKAEIIRLNEELKQRIERTVQLETANKALEAFSYSVSHDLGAPLRAIAGFAKIIQEDYGAKMKPKLKELFKHIINSARRMTAIIDTLLKLAKHSKGKLKCAPIDMMNLTKKVWSNIGHHTHNNTLLELAELPVIQADASMMEQVIMNLLSNAVKYSSKKEKPVVAVWCEQTKEKNTFYFKDNGSGFDMKSSGQLFSAFQRLHTQSDFEGTGVGLMLVKNIVEKHGGKVGAEGKVGEGATFYFSLPCGN